MPPEKVHTDRLGRLKERFWPASQAFGVTIRKLSQPIGKQHLKVTWGRNDTFREWSQLVDGCYLLRTNLTCSSRSTRRGARVARTTSRWRPCLAPRRGPPGDFGAVSRRVSEVREMVRQARSG